MNAFEGLSLKWKLMVGFSIPLILIATVSTVVYFSLNKLLKTSEWVNHTYEAIDLGNSITGSLVNMETGLRGYLVAGKEEFLEPYHQGKGDFQTRIDKAKFQVQDNPQQVSRLNKVESLQNQWQSQHVEIAIGYRKEVSAGSEAASTFKEVSARTVGKDKFDGFRAALAELEAGFKKSNDLEAQNLTKLLLMDMVNQETGQRGFLLSGQEASLDPYTSGLVLFEQHNTGLRTLISNAYDRNAASRNIDATKTLISDWQSQVAAKGIDLKKKAVRGAITNGKVISFVKKGAGKAFFDQVRVHVDALNQDFKKANDILALALVTTVTKNMVDMETGYRGFLLTGKEDSLAPFKSGQSEFSTNMNNLNRLVDRAYDTGDASRQLATAVQLARAWDSEAAKPEIDAREAMNKVTRSMDEVTAFIELGIGKKYMDEMRGVLDGFVAEETALIGVRNAEQQATAAWTKQVTIVGALLALFIGGFVTFFLTGVVLRQLGADPLALSDIAEQIADGNLNLNIDQRNSTGVQRSMARMRDNLDARQKADEDIQKEIDVLINAAIKGDFTCSIDLNGKDGFFRALSEGLNNVMATTEVAVNDVQRVLSAISKGDLTESITRNYDGVFGQLKDDANETVSKLTDVIGNIRISSDEINRASNEISQGNKELSNRTEAQASSLEETASSMEEMTSTVRQSAENSKEANQLATAAQANAIKGGEVVKRAIQSMDEINRVSKKIADIISVIDEIAFQTNLLALNAAVEAARAGEQGRGFAVVAGEVRNLAQRSATAAREIKDLIRDSVEKVADGSLQVNESGTKLAEIVESVEKVCRVIEEITVASEEQSSGIELVNQAVAEMDNMTQQNAALVEEAAAASESMAGQAFGMREKIEFFNLSGSGASQTVASVAVKREVKWESKPAPQAPVQAQATGTHGGGDSEWEEF